eukprot:759722-Hanusia_phi.AAC.1
MMGEVSSSIRSPAFVSLSFNVASGTGEDKMKNTGKGKGKGDGDDAGNNSEHSRLPLSQIIPMKAMTEYRDILKRFNDSRRYP